MKKIIFLLAVALSSIPCVNAGTFTNGGTYSCRNLNIEADILNNTGRIEASEEGLIVCSKLMGNGIIVAQKKMRIVAEEFAFTGTIECNGTCTVLSKNKVDQATVTIKGSGVVTFEVSE